MASEAVKRQRAVRRRMFVRTMVASSALFTMLFVLMAGQMVLGRDPALGAGRQPAAPAQVAQRPAADGDWKAVAGQAVGALVGDVVIGAIDGDDDHEGAPVAAPSSQAPAQAPAPVQSGTS